MEAGKGPTLTRYWQIEDAEADTRLSPDEYVARFRELFLDSLRLRLRSDVPVGTGLSGGLDSSSVVAGLRRLLTPDGPPPRTFSARYREGNVDEGVYIDAVVNKCAVEAHHVWLSSADVPEELDRLVWHQDEPFVGLSMYAQYKVMRLCKEAGVTVLLDGQGADEQLGGYHPPSFGARYASLMWQLQVLGLVKELAAYRRNHGQLRRGIRYLIGALLPPPLWVALKARRGAAISMIAGDLWETHRESIVAENAPRFDNPLKGTLHQQLTNTSLPSLLRFGDRSSMAFSREVRLPFLDHRLVAISFRLPEELLVSDGTTKVVLRRAMAADLPP